MTQQIDELLDAYWNAAYREGKEGRTHDTPDGKAQAIRSAIEAALKPGEPIAFYDGKKFYGSLEAASMCMADTKKLVPVYTAAPPSVQTSKPPTYEQIYAVVRSKQPYLEDTSTAWKQQFAECKYWLLAAHDIRANNES